MNRVKHNVVDANIRINNFDEVSLGYTKNDAIIEASRCLNCPNPRCVSGCPVKVMIPAFIQAIKNDDISLAYKIISESNLLPAICGRVCPQENQCEKMCIKGFKGESISIGALERYVADEAMKNNIKIKDNIVKNGMKVAVIGSGPSGLTCASNLAKMGYDVTIYEALHKAGGVLTYGIPEFRLPKSIVEKEIKSIEDLGVNIVLNAIVGKSITIDELDNMYDAIYVATGAGLPKFMGIKNENANGVFSANEILTRINLMGAYKKDSKNIVKVPNKAIVVGGGNVAMDAARSLKRLGSEVHIVYRRSMNELPARKEEVEHAIEEGIIFDTLTNPTEILIDDNNNVQGINVIGMELIPSEENERMNVREIKGSEFRIDADCVVMAIGTTPNPVLVNNSDILADDHGHIIVDGTKTNRDNIFAGGDIVTGSATVILACEAGKKAANEINEYLINK